MSLSRDKTGNLSRMKQINWHSPLGLCILIVKALILFDLQIQKHCSEMREEFLRIGQNQGRTFPVEIKWGIDMFKIIKMEIIKMFTWGEPLSVFNWVEA